VHRIWTPSRQFLHPYSCSHIHTGPSVLTTISSLQLFRRDLCSYVYPPAGINGRPPTPHALRLSSRASFFFFRHRPKCEVWSSVPKMWRGHVNKTHNFKTRRQQAFLGLSPASYACKQARLPPNFSIRMAPTSLLHRDPCPVMYQAPNILRLQLRRARGHRPECSGTARDLCDT
jgi:uncharacterized C2H2 Zn-finger protein